MENIREKYKEQQRRLRAEESEIWKDIPWYEWIYQASNLWNIFNIRNNRKLIPSVHNSWYLQIWLSNNWKISNLLHHRVIWLTFLNNIENKSQINHINWNKHDNRVENLEWNTQSENMLHSYNTLWNKPANKWKFWILNYNAKKINQYDLQGNFIKTWNSWADIHRELWVSRSGISSCCNWKGNYSWWFKWSYSN